MTNEPRPLRPAYRRCVDSSCRLPDCPQCHAETAAWSFLQHVQIGDRQHLRGINDRAVLIYHIPRTGGTFLADVFERLEVLLLRPDFPADAKVVDDLLHHGERRGIVILAHSAAALKERHPDVDFLEYAACWRDPFEICASEYHGIRSAPADNHLFSHHLRDDCLRCDSIADWVEQHARGNPISNVLGDNRPKMLHAGNYAEDVGAMLQQILGEPFDLVRDYGFTQDSLRPGRWTAGASREDLARMRELNGKDYELWQTWQHQSSPVGSR